MKRKNGQAKGRWLSLTEAVEYVNRHSSMPIVPRTMERWMADGLPFARIAGTTVRILTADLDEWLAARTATNLAGENRPPLPLTRPQRAALTEEPPKGYLIPRGRR